MDTSAIIPIHVIRYFFIAVGLIAFAALAQILKIIIEAYMNWWFGKRRKETGETYRRKSEEDLRYLTRVIESLTEILKQVHETQIRTTMILERQESVMERMADKLNAHQHHMHHEMGKLQEKFGDK